MASRATSGKAGGATAEATRLYHLAEQHRKAGWPKRAIALYRELLQAVPQHLAALEALEALLEAEGDGEGASATHCQRMALEAENAYAIGKALTSEGEHGRAASFFERAVALQPDYRKAHWRLGESYSYLKRPADALRCYRRCLELDPRDGDVRYMIAALGGADAPPRAPEAYVKHYFDNYAGTFDTHLCNDLDYCGPDVLFDYAKRAMGGRKARFDILDIGCGTGLAGKKFRGLAQSLTGVDLSPEMLAQAKALAVYDHLHLAEATAFLADMPAGCFDLMIACDSLVYTGDLAPVMAAATDALRPGGVFLLSLEKGRAPGFALQASGRYAHHPDYLPGVIQDRLSIAAAGEEVLRREYGAPVIELVYALVKPAP